MRQVLAVVVLMVGLACGASSPKPPPPPLTVTCGTYNAGESVGTVLAAVFEPVRATATDLTVDGVAGPRTVTCPAGQRLCLTAMPEMAARPAGGGTAFQVTVTTGPDAGSQRFTCTPGQGLLAQPGGSAAVSAGQITATWGAVPGAVKYRATLRDLGPPGVAPATVLDSLTTTATQATFTFPGTTPELAIVEVEAWAIDPAAPLAGSLPAGGANRSMRALPFGSASWSLKLPSDFSGTTLTLPVPAGQRLAVTLLNIGGPEGASATIEVAGTAALAPAVATVRLLGPGDAAQATARGWLRDQFTFEGWSQSLDAGTGASHLDATAAADPPPTTRTFCTRSYGPGATLLGLVRRTATLVRTTATGLFYLDDANAADIAPGDWDVLTAIWEGGQASVVGRTGPAPDVDGNGRETFFFTGALGPASGVGGFVGNDATAPLDSTPNCTGTGSNQADMMHINTVLTIQNPDGSFLSHADSLTFVGNTLLHEFQHLVDKKRFCLDRTLCYSGDGWLMEGRAELSSTLAGTGLHMPFYPVGRSEFFTRGVAIEGYPHLRFMPWEFGNSNYGSSNFFLQYLADRLGPSFVTAFYQEGNTLAQLEAISGLPFPVAYGLWTSALLFSNEPANPWPVLNYTGTDWTPLHQKARRFEYAPLFPGAAVPITLRLNGFDVYVTGAADAGGGTVTITSNAAVKPHVVVVPFTGTLP